MVGIGNCSGAQIEKFQKFGLTPEPGVEVKVPLIAECYANLECKLADAKLVNRYNFFIFEVVKAHAATSPKYPKTLHYYGEGMFMVSGRTVNLRRGFRPEMLR
jgi:flavin reductase (DIM6/NTAB) family NADH-FMN oxidoreductase RutF